MNIQRVVALTNTELAEIRGSRQACTHAKDAVKAADRVYAEEVKKLQDLYSAINQKYANDLTDYFGGPIGLDIADGYAVFGGV